MRAMARVDARRRRHRRRAARGDPRGVRARCGTCRSAPPSPRGVTLSTFHGTPADEIERIGEFLIGELGLPHRHQAQSAHARARARRAHPARACLATTSIDGEPRRATSASLAFEDAVGMVRRLQGAGRAARRRRWASSAETRSRCSTAARSSRSRCSTCRASRCTRCTPRWPLRWREAFGDGLQISFSAGVDAHNVADCVAAGLVPVTTCTDLLRAGGYGRLVALLRQPRGADAGGRGARRSPSSSLAFGGTGRCAGRRASGDDGARPGNADQHAGAARRRRCPIERYRAAQNRKPPRKLGTHLWLWDCLSCSKCIPACPNDAMFEIESSRSSARCPSIEVGAAPAGARRAAGSTAR